MNISAFRAVIGAAALVLAVGVAAQPIRLGELNSYKQFPAFLEPYKKGMELALAEINASGGVLGRQLEIVSRDDNGNPGDSLITKITEHPGPGIADRACRHPGAAVVPWSGRT